MRSPRGTWVTTKNIIETAVYYASCHTIAHTWLNDRDQFLYPNDGWKKDKDFQSDCLAFTLFNNVIRSTEGTNHWIPFTEWEVDAKDKFDSHFMTDFIKGKHTGKPIVFTDAAKAVMDAGRALWTYYHAQPHANANASFYDIRLHFQGTDGSGRMNADSSDPHYTDLIKALRAALSTLAKQIEPKVYAYGFLK